MGDLLVGEYLLKRVKELGVKSVFGVPGDFELAFLDLVLQSDLKWRGNPNELIAAYAADGYARVNGVGAVVTTFGPGETSALCGIAGAYTEFVPVVHIVGYPSIKAQRKHMILHHTLGEGKFNNYHEMSKQICCATTVLEDGATAAAEIDRVLNAMMTYSQPVYIGIPTDVTYERIPATGLEVPITISLDPNNDTLESKVVTEVRKMLETYTNTIIIVDGGATRHQVLDEVVDLMELSQLPVFVTAMGKGAVNEQSPRFGGIYGGAASKPDVREAVESSDCVLWVGNYPSDFNTGEFSEHVKPEAIIDFESFWVKVGVDKYNVKMKYVLQRLNKSLRDQPLARQPQAMTCRPYPEPTSTKPQTITQDWIWPRLSSFLRESDVIITENGTSSSGFNATHLPQGVKMFTQPVFGSIGYATGAAVGAFVAAHELEAGSKRRTILITGDGSLQMTVQALTNLLRYGTKPIIFVINNDGYTVERVIHGPDELYNDIPNWKYTQLFEVFGPEVESKSYQARTSDELETLLNDPAFGDVRCAKLVEVFMDKYDAPAGLKKMGAAVDRFNAGEL